MFDLVLAWCLICLAWCLICLALFGLVFALFLALFGFVVFALLCLLYFCATTLLALFAHSQLRLPLFIVQYHFQTYNKHTGNNCASQRNTTEERRCG